MDVALLFEESSEDEDGSDDDDEDEDEDEDESYVALEESCVVLWSMLGSAMSSV